MMRCDECKHWKRDEADMMHSWTQKYVHFGKCTAVPERWEVLDEATRGIEYAGGEGDWYERSDDPPPPGSYSAVRLDALRKLKACVQDGSDYRADLLTQADFFCALFASVDGRRMAETENTGSVPQGTTSAVPSEVSADAPPPAPSLQTPQGGDS